MAKTKLMKDGLGPAAIRRIAVALDQVHSDFDSQAFLLSAGKGLQKLELKQRVSHVIETLAEYLPRDFRQAAKILCKIPGIWDPGDEKDVLRGFAAWPLIDYVGVYGQAHPRQALQTLRRLTPLFSAEFAVRPFLQQHTATTLNEMEKWAQNKDPHVRRLVSEGTRPRLPWGVRLQNFIDDPGPVMRILELLKDDDSEYVRRSVANNLNDISKDHPELVIRTGRRWLKGAGTERRWIIRHAVRTLIKQGYDEVFVLLGHEPQPAVQLGKLNVKPVTLRLGQSMAISFDIHSRGRHQQSLVLDYRIHFVRANGSRGAKVFKLRNIKLSPGEKMRIEKSHSFRPITTRRYYPGQHIVEIIVNGQVIGKTVFELAV